VKKRLYMAYRGLGYRLRVLFTLLVFNIGASPEEVPVYISISVNTYPDKVNPPRESEPLPCKFCQDACGCPLHLRKPFILVP